MLSELDVEELVDDCVLLALLLLLELELESFSSLEGPLAPKIFISSAVSFRYCGLPALSITKGSFVPAGIILFKKLENTPVQSRYAGIVRS